MARSGDRRRFPTRHCPGPCYFHMHFRSERSCSFSCAFRSRDSPTGTSQSRDTRALRRHDQKLFSLSLTGQRLPLLSERSIRHRITGIRSGTHVIDKIVRALVAVVVVRVQHLTGVCEIVPCQRWPKRPRLCRPGAAKVEPVHRRRIDYASSGEESHEVQRAPYAVIPRHVDKPKVHRHGIQA